MHEIRLFNRETQQRGYCSQTRLPWRPIQTIENGLQAIERLINQEVLCYHDVEDINCAFKEIDLLEKKIDSMPKRTSCQALQIIIAKITSIMQKHRHDLSAQNLIWLYQFKNFSDMDLEIEKQFNKVFQRFQKTSNNMQEIAQRLPMCSREQFEQDVKALIGHNFDQQVQKILEQRREKLQAHEHLQKTIEGIKKELEVQRQQNPQNYPLYLNELLEEGYTHLYNHLLQMKQLGSRNERRTECEKISFSELSHIVLETMKAILHKVENSIPSSHSNTLFLVGNSGGGKSTTLCYLRGDQMVLNGFQYVSQNDEEGLIGHAGAISRTFLPTVEVVNGLMIVDFPGFDDSNGPLISLGMEFALKILIKRCPYSKILVIEAITNTEGRFAAAAQLGARLNRLLWNKSHCLLGITKYSRDPDFGRIKMIEGEQRRSLLAPSDQERALDIQIKALSGLNMPILQSQIETLQEQLNNLRREKAAPQLSSLPDTDLKKESRMMIREREEELLKQTGLESLVRLDDLENPALLLFLRKTLSRYDENGTQVNHKHHLDPDGEKLLEDRFQKDLKLVMENQKEGFISFKNFKAFQQSVLESSLINTILALKYPEIGQLLHLPEIDPSLVRAYDKAIVDSCIKNCVKAVVIELNVSFIQKVLKDEKIVAMVSKNKLINLKKESEILRNYVLGLLGSLPEDPTKAEEQWRHIQKEHRKAVIDLEKTFELPTWAIIALCLPLGIPYGVRSLYKWMLQKQETQKNLEKLIAQCSEEVKQTHDVLIRLKDIAKIIEKQDLIDTAFYSVQIPEDKSSPEELLKISIRRRIDLVKTVYGSGDWDERIHMLKRKLSECGYHRFHFEEDVIGRTVALFRDGSPLIGHLRSSLEIEREVTRMNKETGGAKKKAIIINEFAMRMEKETEAERSYFSALISQLEIDTSKPLFRAMLGAAILSFSDPSEDLKRDANNAISPSTLILHPH